PSLYEVNSSWRDAHFQSRRPVLVFVGVVEIGAAGGTGIRAGNGGNQAQREVEIVFGLKIAPVEDDFAADDFVRVNLARLDQFFELIVPDLEASGDSHNGDGSGDHLIALVGDG